MLENQQFLYNIFPFSVLHYWVTQGFQTLSLPYTISDSGFSKKVQDFDAVDYLKDEKEMPFFVGD